jgi:hypothetical protein
MYIHFQLHNIQDTINYEYTAMAATAKDERRASAVLVPAVAHDAHLLSLRRTAAAFVLSFVGVAAVPPGHGLIYFSVECRPTSIEHRASSVVHRALSIERRASSVEHRASSNMRHAPSLSVQYRVSSIERRPPSSLERRPSPIARRVSCVTRAGRWMAGRFELAQPIADVVCTDGL